MCVCECVCVFIIAQALQEQLMQWQEDTNDNWRCAPSGDLIYEGNSCYPLDNNT